MKNLRILAACLIILIFNFCGGSPESPKMPVKNLPTIHSFIVTPSTVLYLEDAVLSWSVSNANRVEIDQGIGEVANSGSMEISWPETVTFKLTATNLDGASTAECTLTVEKRAYFELLAYKNGYTSYGCCCIEGTVRNIGNATGWNVMISFSAYDANETIIDTAHGFPADLGNIPPNVKAKFEAIFFNTRDWNLIKKVTYEISWLTREGVVKTQSGIVVGI